MKKNKENNINKQTKKDNKKIKLNKKVFIPFITLSIISFLSYIIIEVIYNDNLLSSLGTMIGMALIFLFTICFIIISLKSENKNNVPFIIMGFLLIIIFSSFNILSRLEIIKLPKNNYVRNFYNTPITEVYNWKEKNNIFIDEIYEYSDIIPEYHVISQDISSNQLVKDVVRMTFIISKGPDYNKEIIVPSFTGWNYDTVIKYLEDNYLNNVQITFIESNNPVDTVIYQEGSGTRKRNDLIKLTFSKNEIGEVQVIDFTNKSLLYATSWLNKNGFKYELEYENDNEIKKDYIIKQSNKNEVLDPASTTITLTVSKGKIIKVPDFSTMDMDSINKWVMENGLKINYQESYDEEITLGDVISSNVNKDDVIEVGSQVEIVISKGKLEMPKIEKMNDSTIWANEKNIKYELTYDYSDTVLKDDIIKCSHQGGDLIKKEDTIVITISKGKSITIPNFVSMSKSEIQKKCDELKLSCSFKYGGYTETIKKDIATKQSKSKNTVVAEGTSLIITLSSGIYEKVSVPAFTGKTKTEITNLCKNLGITCKFTYQSSFSSTKKDTCVSQSKTGQVNKGSTITITLSKGPAKTYKIVIDANQLSNGNPEATKATLQKKLTSACPGVKFTFKFQKANSGIGYLAPTSQVKVGSNTFTEGKTYTVIINSN